MPSPTNPDFLPCDSCGRPGDVHHFPGASPTSGVWCDKHLARLRWLHPLGDRGRFLWMGFLALGFVALTALRAQAQECRGVPARFVHAFVDRRVLVNGQAVFGAEAGVGTGGALGLLLNYSASEIGRPGSKNVSAGGKVYRQLTGNGIAACLTGGFQRGRSYQVNVDGTNTNFRTKYNTVSVGASASWTLPLTEHTRLMFYAFPELQLQAEKYDQYDRTDWLTLSQSTKMTSISYGASVAVGRIFARLSRTDLSGGPFKSSHVVVLAGGIAW